MSDNLNMNTNSIEQDHETSLFRSVEMTKVQLYIPYEASHATLSILAELGMIQFKDVLKLIYCFS